MAAIKRAGMTPRQRRFVQEYLIDLNATQAATRAGYSARTAEVQGPRLLGNVRVKEAIEKGMESRRQRLQMKADQVLEEYAKIARSDMRDYVSWGPDGVHLKPSEELPDGAAACVAEVSETRGKSPSVRFKLHDKVAALRDLAKHLGLFVERHEFAGKDGQPFKVYLGFDPAADV